MYDSWAWSLAQGEWNSGQVFYFAPLYPFVLGALYTVIGHSLMAVYLLQSLLGLANLVLLYRIGLATFGARAGLLAAGMAALYGPFAFFETKVLGATLGLVLNVAALALLVWVEREELAGKRTPWRWLAPGLCIGAAATCQPGTIVLAPIYAAALVMRRRTAAAGALLVGGLLATVPVMAHNLRAASDPLPLSAQGGLTFYQGNNPGASGYYSSPPGFSGAPATQAAEEKSIAERETGRSMRRSEISAHFLSKGLAFIASAPRSWLVLEARKAMALAGDYEPSTEYSFYFERREIRWLYLLILPFAAVLGAGAGGLMVSGRPRGPALALLLYTLSSALVPLIFYVSSRYRLPLVPALILYAGAFFDRLLQALGGFAARSSGLAPAAALALVVALVS